MIRCGRVAVDGVKIRDIAHKLDADKVQVSCDGEVIVFREFRYFIMNKPAGYITSTEEGREPIVFLHYPPLYGEEICREIYDVLKKYDIKKCFYGHIHGNGYRYAIDGLYDGIDFRLIACDYLEFVPYKIF